MTASNATVSLNLSISILFTIMVTNTIVHPNGCKSTIHCHASRSEDGRPGAVKMDGIHNIASDSGRILARHDAGNVADVVTFTANCDVGCTADDDDDDDAAVD